MANTSVRTMGKSQRATSDISVRTMANTSVDMAPHLEKKTTEATAAFATAPTTSVSVASAVTDTALLEACRIAAARWWSSFSVRLFARCPRGGRRPARLPGSSAAASWRAVAARGVASRSMSAGRRNASGHVAPMPSVNTGAERRNACGAVAAGGVGAVDGRRCGR